MGAEDIDGPEARCWRTTCSLPACMTGRLIRTSLDGKVTKVLADTGGRPLGPGPSPQWLLVIADGIKEAVAGCPGARLIALATAANGVDFGSPVTWSSTSPGTTPISVMLPAASDTADGGRSSSTAAMVACCADFQTGKTSGLDKLGCQRR